MNEPVFPIPVAQPYGDGWMATCPTTLKAYAAIHLRVPDSGIPELDEMIRQARRQEMVGRAFHGLVSNSYVSKTWSEYAKYATEAADATIKAMEEKR